MSEIITRNIRKKALDILKQEEDGIRYTTWFKKVSDEIGENINTIRTQVWRVGNDPNAEENAFVFKYNLVGNSYYFHSLNQPTEEKLKDLENKLEESTPSGPAENEFYKPFADFMQDNLYPGNCIAFPLGGARLTGKWRTPDVLAFRLKGKKDFMGNLEIITAEIKKDQSTEKINEAFAQACCYKLYSNEVYVVIPKQARQDSKNEIDSLCQIHGIGLVIFNNTSPDNPQFEIRVRPIKHNPDIYYANTYAQKILKSYSLETPFDFE